LCVLLEIAGAFRMSFSSDEVNYLVYRYLLESGNSMFFHICSFNAKYFLQVHLTFITGNRKLNLKQSCNWGF